MKAPSSTNASSRRDVSVVCMCREQSPTEWSVGRPPVRVEFLPLDLLLPSPTSSGDEGRSLELMLRCVSVRDVNSSVVDGVVYAAESAICISLSTAIGLMLSEVTFNSLASAWLSFSHREENSFSRTAKLI